MSNPLLAPWTGPYGLPPFAAIRADHFAPAFAEAMGEHLAEIEAIGSAAAAPTFANTVAALDSAGRRLERIGALFHNLTSSETSPALQAVEREMAPILASHDSRVYTHAALFARIDSLHAARASSSASATSSCACSSAITPISSVPAHAWTAWRRSAMPRSCSGSPT